MFITIEGDDLKLLANKYCMCAPWESKAHQWAYHSRAKGTESKETQSREVNSGLAVLQQLEWVFILAEFYQKYVHLYSGALCKSLVCTAYSSSAGVLIPPDGYFL